MKSSLNSEMFRKWVAEAEKEERTKMIAVGAAFGTYMKRDDEENLDRFYKQLQKHAMQMEEKYKIKFLQSPDGKYYRAFLMIANWANTVLAEMQKQQMQVYKVDFDSVQKANEWLFENQNLDVISMELQTSQRLGLFANHTSIKRIMLEYRKNEKTKYLYNILEEEETGVFKRMDVDRYSKKWREKYPKLEVVRQKFYSNARGDAASLAFGFGEYVEHLKIVTLYRVDKD